MPFWLRKLSGRLRGRRIERHRLKVEIKKAAGQTAEERVAMTREIEAEIARQLSQGHDTETTRAAIDEIARRHGGTIERFEND